MSAAWDGWRRRRRCDRDARAIAAARQLWQQDVDGSRGAPFGGCQRVSSRLLVSAQRLIVRFAPEPALRKHFRSQGRINKFQPFFVVFCSLGRSLFSLRIQITIRSSQKGNKDLPQGSIAHATKSGRVVNRVSRRFPRLRFPFDRCLVW